MMKRNPSFLLAVFLGALLEAACCVKSHAAASAMEAIPPSAYLFTSFHVADQKFLRFLYSFDGCHWTNVPGTFLEANAGASKQFLDPGFSVIAPFILNDDRRYVLICKDNSRPNLNLHVAFSKSPLGPGNNVFAPFTEKFTEGPCVLKIGDDRLIYFDAYREKIYGAVETRDFKAFTNITKEVSFPEGHKHGTAIQAPSEILDGV